MNIMKDIPLRVLNIKNVGKFDDVLPIKLISIYMKSDMG